MALLGNLSSINLIAGAGILGNVGGVAITANTDLSNAISTYTSLTPISRFESLVGTGYISQTAVANVFPALTNSLPAAYIGNIGTANSSMTSVIESQSGNILGNGDLGKFDQIFSTAQGYVTQNNQMIFSALNAANVYNTIGWISQDNQITAGLSSISQAYGAFGRDLARLGNLIDLNNLSSLGNPSAIIRQIASYSTIPPGLNTALLNVGIPQETIDNIESQALFVSQEKLVYEAMTQVTGEDLKQVLAILKVTTPGLTTMADLLNPVKIFPTSYITLTAPTIEGIRGIYIDNAGNVNRELEKILPPSVLAPLNGIPTESIK